MSRVATGTVVSRKHEENIYVQIPDGRKLSSITGFERYRGDIEAEARVRGIKLTHADGSGTFVVVERLIGHLSGRFGSFVIESDGSFSQGGGKAKWTIVPNSGTASLQGIRGDGEVVCNAEEGSYTLNYDLDG